MVRALARAFWPVVPLPYQDEGKAVGLLLGPGHRLHSFPGAGEGKVQGPGRTANPLEGAREGPEGAAGAWKKGETGDYHLYPPGFVMPCKLFDFLKAVTGPGEDGTPTKKGLAISPHLWPQFRQALAQVEAAVVTAGWLDHEDLEAQD